MASASCKRMCSSPDCGLLPLCSGIQEAQIPAAHKPESEPLTEVGRPSQSAQEAELPAQPQARPEEDAVDRAAAAQLRLAAQSAPQSTAPETPASLETSSSGAVDAAVAKQSSISSKLAGASVPILDQGAAAAAEAERAGSADGATGNHVIAGSTSSPEAGPSSGESAKQRSTGTPRRTCIPACCCAVFLQIYHSRSALWPEMSRSATPGSNSHICAEASGMVQPKLAS